MSKSHGEAKPWRKHAGASKPAWQKDASRPWKKPEGTARPWKKTEGAARPPWKKTASAAKPWHKKKPGAFKR